MISKRIQLYVLITNKLNSERDIWKREFLPKSNYARLHLTSVWCIYSTAIGNPSSHRLNRCQKSKLTWLQSQQLNSSWSSRKRLSTYTFWRLLFGTLISLRFFPAVSHPTTHHSKEAPFVAECIILYAQMSHFRCSHASIWGKCGIGRSCSVNPAW